MKSFLYTSMVAVLLVLFFIYFFTDSRNWAKDRGCFNNMGACKNLIDSTNTVDQLMRESKNKAQFICPFRYTDGKTEVFLDSDYAVSRKISGHDTEYVLECTNVKHKAYSRKPLEVRWRSRI